MLKSRPNQCFNPWCNTPFEKFPSIIKNNLYFESDPFDMTIKNITYITDPEKFTSETIEIPMNDQNLKYKYQIDCSRPCYRGHDKIKLQKFARREKIVPVDEEPLWSNFTRVSNKVYAKKFEDAEKEELLAGIDRFLELQPNLRRVIKHFAPDKKFTSTVTLRDGNLKIPQFFHFIAFGCDRVFTLINYIALMSIIRFTSNNSKIFLHKMDHCNFHKNQQNNTSLKIKKMDFSLDLYRELGDRLVIVGLRGYMDHIRDDLSQIFGNEIYKIEHQADFYRLLILYKIGGVYLDLDSWLTGNIDEFLKLSVPTLGHASKGTLSNAFITTQKQDKFIGQWLYQYKFYNDTEYKIQLAKKDKKKNHAEYWSRFSVSMAHSLFHYLNYTRTNSQKPIINIEQTRVMRPTAIAMSNFRYGYFDWRNHKSVHISDKHFDKGYKFYMAFELVGLDNTTSMNCIETSLAEVARTILFRDFRSCNYLKQFDLA